MAPFPLCRCCSSTNKALPAEVLPMPIDALRELTTRTLVVLLALVEQCIRSGNGRIVMSRARMREMGFGHSGRIDRARLELFRVGLLAIHKRGVRGARHLYRLTWLPLPEESA